MEKRTYSIDIKAVKSHVWNTMLEPGKYEAWVKAFSANSQFIGEWKQGATVRFVDPALGGTKAVLEIFEPYETIVAKHHALITKEGEEDGESEEAQQWIGTLEKYFFSESEGWTTVTVEMVTHQAFVEMFDACWPEALEHIKALSEKE